MIQTRSDTVADPGETGDDRKLEHAVDRIREPVYDTGTRAGGRTACLKLNAASGEQRARVDLWYSARLRSYGANSRNG